MLTTQSDLHLKMDLCITIWHIVNFQACTISWWKGSGDVEMMQGNEHFKQLQQQVSSAVKQGVKRLHSKINSLQQQMGSTEESQQIQKQADLLTANIYRFPPTQAADCSLIISLPLSFIYCEVLSHRQKDKVHGQSSVRPFLASLLQDSAVALYAMGRSDDWHITGRCQLIVVN